MLYFQVLQLMEVLLEREKKELKNTSVGNISLTFICLFVRKSVPFIEINIYNSIKKNKKRPPARFLSSISNEQVNNARKSLDQPVFPRHMREVRDS